MQTTGQTLRTVLLACRPARATMALGLLLIIGFAPSGLAQAVTPLNFGNNFFVTGDYIVAGAYGMATNSETIGPVTYAVGTINVPDKDPSTLQANPGITGATSVPQGAQIVAALLYWQTVEKVGSPGSGQNGFFRPMLYSTTGGPAAPGYLISGTNVSGSSPVSWSAGGCNTGSTGKILRTYRADVAGGLPNDANGNPIANGSFEVRLPSVGNATPLTLGATLVIIYRILTGAGGPTIPLNAIVIYDGDYAQGNAQLTMTQQLQGFYDADLSPVSRLTHIVGSGQSNKFQTVYLSSGTHPFVALPFLYGNGLPAFPGWYGNWDTTTWTFTNPSTNPLNPGVLEDDSNATTQVVPSVSNQGCVSWGAIIVSTTVKNGDNDGILDSWKLPKANPPGYCDAALNNGVCSAGSLTDPGWVPLPGATHGQQDVFLQYDYMCSAVTGPNSCTVGGANADYSFDPRLATDPADGLTAVDKVVLSYANNNGSNSHHSPVVLHASPGNAIEESQTNVSCADTDSTCPFPNEPGTVGFREGLAYIKNQTIEPRTGVLGCDPSTDATCVAVFAHGKKDSYHYALFSHGVGLPNWFLSDGSISSVSQSGNTVTFTTSLPHGIKPIVGDSLCSSNKDIGRVTVVFAITNPNLNGTYCAMEAKPPSPNQFAIVVGGNSTTATYTSKTDPNLAVANGQVTSMSGYSDVGGQNSVISLGYGNWGPPNNPASDGNKWQMKAGTFMHELGHTMALTHGGTFYPNLGNNPPDYTPTYEVNCKPNAQTSMSYLFQFDLLEVPGQVNAMGNPLMVVDYSEDPPPASPGLIATLTESLPEGPNLLNGLSYAKTAWFQLTSFAGGTPVSPHCDGTPLLGTDQPMSYVSDFVNNFSWTSTTGEDINFNGTPNPAVPAGDIMHGHNEWGGTAAVGGVAPSPGLDLQQVSAVGTISTIGPGGEAGGLKPAGGGGGLKPAGGGGGLQPAGGGGGLKPAGGGGLSAEINHETANSYARPPRDLTITQEEASPRFIHLSWFVPTFGQVVQYNIYRSADGGQTFTLIHSNTGNPPATTFQDTVSCNVRGYSYRVTTVVNNDALPPQQLESVPSNTVPASGQALLTGCYVVTNFSSPASATGNSVVPITWTLTDDFWIALGDNWASAITTNPVTRQAANTLVAIGPLPNHCKTLGARTTLLLNGIPQNSAGTFANSGNLFTFTWNTKSFCSGSYTFELDLDSTQTQTTTPPLLRK